MEKIITIFIWLILIFILSFLLVFSVRMNIIKNEEYKQISSWELKGITNKEYTLSKAQGSLKRIFLIHGQYTSETTIKEYYLIWIKTNLGFKKTKLDSNNVYLIEDNHEIPRVEYYCIIREDGNGIKNIRSNTCYYQIYIPKGSIYFDYSIDKE